MAELESEDYLNGTDDSLAKDDNSDDFLSFLYPYFTNRDPSSFGAWLVFMEMGLALLGIILNLTVLISIKEKESLSNNTVTIVLANLCFANLVSAVFVMCIAVIYHGYAVATSRWKVELAFCAVYTMTTRATWAVFPYTIVVLCWHGLASRVGMLLVATEEDGESLSAAVAHGYMTGVAAVGGIGEVDEQDPQAKALRKSSSIEDHKDHTIVEQEQHPHIDEEEDDDDEFSEGLTARQKSAIGFIWFTAISYALMAEEIMSKERDIQCSVRSDLSEKMNMLSLVVAIGIPLAVGPILCPLGHILLSVGACMKDAVSNTNPQGHQHDSNDPRNTVLDCGLIFGFILVFLIFYPTHMYVVEVYLGSIKTQFAFMSFKYCFGCMHLVLLPILILIIRKDICKAAVDTYVKKSPNAEQAITYEDFQKNTGIGVQVNS